MRILWASEIEAKDPPNYDHLVARAHDMKSPWGEQSTNHVKCRFGRLSKVLWVGRQWAVTNYGIERRDGGYHISKDRLWEDEDVHGWVRHLGCKVWTDIEDFTEALRIARCVHDPEGK